MPVRAVAVALSAMLALAGCSSGGGDDAGDGPVRVVAAFHPLAEAARQVGGADVRVDDLTPPGAEAHDLEITPDDVDAIEDADLVLYVRGGFQPAIEEVAERQGDRALDLLPADAHGDPHFWLDPRRYAAAVRDVAAALADIRPRDRAAFERRAGAYRDDLAALDAEIASTLRRCERRVIITTHISFGYLAERYDLESASIAGTAPESEPDADRISELAALIDAGGITTVFTEPLAPPRIARTLAREAGVEVAVLDPLESRTDDDGDGDDYLSVMRANAAALAKALECSP